MLPIVYASYGTAMGHRQEVLAQAAQSTADRQWRPSPVTEARRVAGAVLVRVGRRLSGNRAGAVAGRAPAPAGR